MTTFDFKDSELDFGKYTLGGDWLLKIKTEDEGLTFVLVDAESCQWGVEQECFALIQKWIDGDTAPRQRAATHKSLVRAAYEASLPDDPLRDEDHPDNSAPLWRSWRAA